MLDQDVKPRPLDGNARTLQPDTELGENVVNEALIARRWSASSERRRQIAR
jgi:hypothetical protein